MSVAYTDVLKDKARFSYTSIPLSTDGLVQRHLVEYGAEFRFHKVLPKQSEDFIHVRISPITDLALSIPELTHLRADVRGELL